MSILEMLELIEKITKIFSNFLINLKDNKNKDKICDEY